MPKELTKDEFKERLIRLRNLERLYPIARERTERLEKENKELKQQLAAVIATYDALIEKLKLRIEELEKMIFGRRNRKKPESDNQKKGRFDKLKNLFKKKRSALSFRRPISKQEDIAEVIDYPIEKCPDCGTALEDCKMIIRYLEDIIALKKVEKHRIQTGYCPRCQKRRTAKPISPQMVSLGENVKMVCSFANVVLKSSFEEIQALLKGLFNIHLSDGEISHILEKQGQRLLPQYHQLKANIRGQPAAHYDETGYPVQQEEQGKYSWVMTGTETPDTVFSLGQSRGKGNAEKLKGEDNQEQVGITDDYGAYRALFKCHQLCWAHPLRKLRDLSDSESLPAEKREHCQKTYQDLNNLHQALKESLVQPFDLAKRQTAKQQMLKQLTKLAKLHPQDPSKLITIKHGFLKNKEKYFTCLDFKAVPTTNNKAERALRHLVLKRKCSFGSKTQKGAETMSVLCSVLLSLWWSKPKNFFQEYALLLNSA